jgi:hypothetical protein
MNLRTQHQTAVNLLRKLGLDYVRLEFRGGTHCTYRAWSTPTLANHNDDNSRTITRRGWIKIL